MCAYILCVFVSYCVVLYYCECSGVDLVGLKSSLTPIFIQCFDTVGWVI